MVMMIIIMIIVMITDCAVLMKAFSDTACHASDGPAVPAATCLTSTAAAVCPPPPAASGPSSGASSCVWCALGGAHSARHPSKMTANCRLCNHGATLRTAAQSADRRLYACVCVSQSAGWQPPPPPLAASVWRRSFARAFVLLPRRAVLFLIRPLWRLYQNIMPLRHCLAPSFRSPPLTLARFASFVRRSSFVVVVVVVAVVFWERNGERRE
jgi:hypothetical protein